MASVAKIWIVKDQTGAVRVVAEDPSAEMAQAGRQKAVFQAPSGVLLSSLVMQVAPLDRSMARDQGNEAFIEIQIGS